MMIMTIYIFIYMILGYSSRLIQTKNKKNYDDYYYINDDYHDSYGDGDDDDAYLNI
jgi:TM2 domain-containing membrane protein YozV